MSSDLMLQGKEFAAGTWYTFNNVAQYNQLTPEELEEKIKNRRKSADAYERWMIKAAFGDEAIFKQDEEDEEENGEEGGGLSQSGKELKKLLGKNNEVNEPEPAQEDDDDDDDDDIEEDESSPVLAPKANNGSSKRNNALKEEPVDNSPSKAAATAGAARGTPTSKSSKGKRKNGDDAKTANGAAPSKKVKTENDKSAFADILRKISKIQKTNGPSYVVLRDK